MTTDEDEHDILPITHAITLKEHQRPATAISIDPSGSRLVSSARDCDIKLWDFNGMDSSLQSFKTVSVEDGAPVLSL
jgi:WD40 repeat protein